MSVCPLDFQIFLTFFRFPPPFSDLGGGNFIVFLIYSQCFRSCRYEKKRCKCVQYNIHLRRSQFAFATASKISHDKNGLKGAAIMTHNARRTKIITLASGLATNPLAIRPKSLCRRTQITHLPLMKKRMCTQGLLKTGTAERG